MSLSPETIQTIRERADIVRIIGAYVDLRKQGQRHVGLCPFHGEKTPSFSVTQAKGLYYCFGCHAGGDVFAFLMRHQGIDFHEAVRRLALDAGVELAPESPQVQRQRRLEGELGRTNDYAQAFFAHALGEPQGRAARDYLKERGIPEAFARERGLGFGGEPMALSKYLKAKHVPVEAAARAGLLTEDGKRSLFDGRLTFAIYDPFKRLAGFGGRRLGEGDAPKYINSRESALFHKRRLLYGWEVAEAAIRRSGRAVIVEGYTDVLACERAGVWEVVAALGTAFTDEHAATCARLAKEAVVLLDADAAGQRASHEVVEKLLRAKLRTLVAALPPGDDPDSLVARAGPEALATAVATARPALEHFIEQSFARAASIEEKAGAAQALAPLVAALASGLERDLYTARIAERVGVSVEQLKAHLATAKRPRLRPAKAPALAPPPPPGFPKAELEMLRELLLYPELRPRLGELAEFVSDQARVLLESLAASEEPVAEVLARHVGDANMVSRLMRVAPARSSDAQEQEQRAARTFDDVLTKLKRRHLRERQREVRHEMASAEGDAAIDLLRDHGSLTRRERELRRPQAPVRG